MSQWQGPRIDPDRTFKALVVALIILSVILILMRPGVVRAASPEPFWAPAGTLMGVLYVSDGKNFDTIFGGVYWDTGSTVGTIFTLDANGEYVLTGEVTITYWVEPSPST